MLVFLLHNILNKDYNLVKIVLEYLKISGEIKFENSCKIVFALTTILQPEPYLCYSNLIKFVEPDKQ